MLIKKFFLRARALASVIALFGGFGCEGVFRQPPSEALKAERHDEDKRHRLILVGQGPVYVIQDPSEVEGSGPPLIAEVRLWKDAAELTEAFVYDSKVTGETLYSLSTEPFRLADLHKPRAGSLKRTSFVADVKRGYLRLTGDHFLHAVGVKVVRLIPTTPAPIHPCGLLLFGSERELFGLVQAPPEAVAQLLRVRLGWINFTQQQGQAIKGGICLNAADPLARAPLARGQIFRGTTTLLGRQLILSAEVVDASPLSRQAMD